MTSTAQPTKETTADPMVSGTELELGGEIFIVPALSLRSAKQFKGRLSEINDLDTVCEIVHAAMQRNYPNITRDRIEDLVDMANFKDLLDAVVSGKITAPDPAAE